MSPEAALPSELDCSTAIDLDSSEGAEVDSGADQPQLEGQEASRIPPFPDPKVLARRHRARGSINRTSTHGDEIATSAGEREGARQTGRQSDKEGEFVRKWTAVHAESDRKEVRVLAA